MPSDTAPHPETNGATPVERAEAVVDRLGDRLNGLRQSAARTASPAASAPPAGLPTERADEMLTQAGERLGRWLAAASREVRRAAALAREEAEDIWAEAQSLRHGAAPETPAPEAPAETAS